MFCSGELVGGLGFFPTKDMQTHSLFKSGEIYRKDAQWTETNEKSIFRFLRFSIFEIWSISDNLDTP